MPRKTAQQRRIEQLLAKQSSAIEKAFIQAIAKAKLNVDRAELLRLLEAGQIERAAQLFRIERGVMFPISEAIRDAFIAGGMAVADDLPKGLSGRFGFDGRHPRAVNIATEQAARLLTAESETAMDNARAIIVDGLDTNRGLDSVARDLGGRKVGKRRVGGVIGLDAQQVQRQINLRAIVSDPDRIGEYFKDAGMKTARYSEGNRRFDARVRKAIKDGKALSAKDVDALVEAYKVKAGGARAKRVARNEAFVSQSSGRAESYQQMMGRPDVETATVRWQKSPRLEDREDHQQMDGKTITVGEMFTLPDGTQMAHPHDQRGGAKHNANCGCVGIYRVRLKRG